MEDGQLALVQNIPHRHDNIPGKKKYPHLFTFTLPLSVFMAVKQQEVSWFHADCLSVSMTPAHKITLPREAARVT